MARTVPSSDREETSASVLDFGRAMWEWNSARQGVERAVRFAVVSDFVASDLVNIDGVALAGGNGLPVPLASVTPNPIICDNSTCNGFGPRDAVAYDAIVARIRDYFPRVDAPGVNVEVIYEHVGLGFSGNPFGADIVPMVTVRMTGLIPACTTFGIRSAPASRS